MILSLGFDARAARSVPYCRTGVVGSARSFPASEQSRSRKASVTGLVELGTPALYEPHFDQFGSGADVVRPAGEQFGVAVVAAANESGDSGIFQPALDIRALNPGTNTSDSRSEIAPTLMGSRLPSPDAGGRTWTVGGSVNPRELMSQAHQAGHFCKEGRESVLPVQLAMRRDSGNWSLCNKTGQSPIFGRTVSLGYRMDHMTDESLPTPYSEDDRDFLASAGIAVSVQPEGVLVSGDEVAVAGYLARIKDLAGEAVQVTGVDKSSFHVSCCGGGRRGHRRRRTGAVCLTLA